MAAKPPKDPKNQANRDKKRSWLSTDDWLGVAPSQTPPPPSTTQIDAGQTTDNIELPEDAIGGEMASEGPGSVLPIGREQGQLANLKTSGSPSSIIAKADLADQTAAMPQPDDDDAIDLATPPGGATTGPPSLSKILKATGTKSDIIRGGKAEGTDYTPTAPGSGWLTGNRMPPKSGSRVDIGNAPRIPDDSDIFANARGDQSGASGSNLLPGLSGVGRSSVFSESRSSTGLGAGGESDLFAGLTGAGDRGSSLFDDSTKKTEKVAPVKDDEGDIFRNAPAPSPGDNPSDVVPLMGEDILDEFDARPISSGPPSSARLADRLLAGLADSAGYARPDFDTIDKTQSGSNLFDDVTAMDIDLGPESGVSGTSGLNWLDPNRTGAQDSGPGSSIFHKMPGGESSDPGRVDLSQIPLMGSTDDPNEMVQLSDLSGPPSSVLKKELQKAMRELKAEGGISFDLPESDEGKIAWGTPQATIDAQMSMRMPVTDDELDLAAPPSGARVGLPKLKEKKDSDSFFDDELVVPDDSGILVRSNTTAMSASILQGMTSDKLRFQNETTQVAPPTRAKAPSTGILDLKEKSKSSRGNRGWLIAGASLAAGVAAGAAGMYLAHSSFSKTADTEGQQIAAVGYERWRKLGEAERMLATGDPEAALDAYRAIKEETPAMKAGRGQATWMARLRNAAGKNQKLPATDPALVSARADLQSVLDNPEGLTSPEDQKAGLRAALNLGLIHEATGKPSEAIKVYKDMAVKLPAFKKVFDSAGRRVALMLQKPDGSKLPDNQYTFETETLRELADANRILLDFDSVQAVDDEAGFHFWEAVGYASTMPGSYDAALKSLDAARAAHASRRQKLIGMGLNPLSDPTEQIFLRTCDELKNHWTLKRQLYSDPAIRAVAKSKTTEAILKDLLAAQGSAKILPAELAALTKKATDAEAAAKTALKERETAEVVAKSLQTDRDALAKQVADLNRTMTTAKTAAAAAAEKVKATEAAIDPLIAKLKAAKLIAENATREQALAALPKIALGGTNADLAKELAALTDRYTTETADAKKKIAALETAVKDVESKTKQETEKAVAAVKKEKDEKIAALANEARVIAVKAEADRQASEQRAREIAEANQVQLAAVRAGAAVVISDLERDKIDQAIRAFNNGGEAYSAGRYSAAESFFKLATDKNPNDARFWYFLGLAKFQQGRDATNDFKKGATLEARNLPTSSDISTLLINVQGAPRQALDAARP